MDERDRDGTSRVGAGRPVILLVEDNEHVRLTLVDLLESFDYDVIAATGPTEALDYLRSDAAIAVVFSDILMQHDMDGFDLAEEARRLRPAIGILLTSGKPPARERISSIDQAEFVAKPYRLDDLLAALARLSA